MDESTTTSISVDPSTTRHRWSSWIDSRLQQKSAEVEIETTQNGLRRRNVSVEKFNEQQKKAMSSFSSVNYSPTHSVSFIQWLSNQKHRFYSRLEFDRWFLITLVGITVGLVAALLQQSITALTGLQWTQTKSYLNSGDIVGGFWFAVGVNCGYGVVCAILVTFVHPPAVGGGTSDVIAFLNGIVVHGTLSMKNLVVKFVANVCAVSSGLPTAIQAPIITYGAIVGAGVGQFQSKTLGYHPNAFTRFRNAHDRRDFTTAGVAAGLSAGFNAPIAGLLFAMEDLSSFWTKASSLYTFYCSVVAAILAELFNTAFSGFQYVANFGTLTESVVDPVTMHFLTLIPAIVLGILGGLFGALFTHTNTFICRQRDDLLSRIPNMFVQKIIRILETLLVIIIMTVYSVFLPFAFSCQEFDTNITSIQGLSSTEDQLLPCYDRLCGVLKLVKNSHKSVDWTAYIVLGDMAVWFFQFGVRTNQVQQVQLSSIAREQHNHLLQLSTLIEEGGTSQLTKLWSRSTYYVFDYYTCLTAFACYFFMTMWTEGTAIAGGVFIPLLISGSLYGRALGDGMMHLWQAITGTPYPTSEWKWLDPGVMAAIGAAGLLSGVNRLAVASTVIVVEMVGDINLIIPNLIAVFTSIGVADLLSKPLFKCELEAKVVPYLEQEPKVKIAGEQLNLELYRASDVMTQPVISLHNLETIDKLANTLLLTGHGGYPVTKVDVKSGDEVVYGFLTRNELYVILCSEDVYKEDRAGTVIVPTIPYEELSVDYITDRTAVEERIRSYSRFKNSARIYVDLEPFVNLSTPKVDRDYSLYRTYVIFRTLGLRHLTVVDECNRVVGIITRKDLMQFRMQERLELLLRPTNVQNTETGLADNDRSGMVANSKDNTTPDNRGPDHGHYRPSVDNDVASPHGCSTDGDDSKADRGMSMSTIVCPVKNGGDEIHVRGPRGSSLDQTAVDDDMDDVAASGLLEVDTQLILCIADSDSKSTILQTPL